jgi:hypothetical protein
MKMPRLSAEEREAFDRIDEIPEIAHSNRIARRVRIGVYAFSCVALITLLFLIR